MKLSPISGDMAVKLAIGAGAVLAVYLIAKKAGDSLGAVGQGFSDAVDTVLAAPGAAYDAAAGAVQSTGAWIDRTGAGITAAVDDNAVTRAARTDAYTGKAIWGTLGAATDIASGGNLSRAGEALGGWIYDITH
jgi:hypothetical protein